MNTSIGVIFQSKVIAQEQVRDGSILCAHTASSSQHLNSVIPPLSPAPNQRDSGRPVRLRASRSPAPTTIAALIRARAPGRPPPYDTHRRPDSVRVTSTPLSISHLRAAPPPPHLILARAGSIAVPPRAPSGDSGSVDSLTRSDTHSRGRLKSTNR